jgi:hypothetical protein
MIPSGVRGLIVFALAFVLVPAVALGAGDGGQFKRADGLAVYLGLLPAAMVQGHPEGHPERAMHGGVPMARHASHVLAAVFDAASGERVEDVQVEARVAPLGLAGVRRPLEPMAIADTVTYGNYFDLPGEGRYRIELSIRRPGAARAVELAFDYEHRMR